MMTDNILISDVFFKRIHLTEFGECQTNPFSLQVHRFDEKTIPTRMRKPYSYYASDNAKV